MLDNRHEWFAQHKKRFLFALPWVFVLVFTSWFQFFRGATIDGFIFLIAGVALGIDSLVIIRLPKLTRPKVSDLLIVAVIALITIIMTLSPQFSLVDVVVVVALGLFVLPYVWVGLPARQKNAKITPTKKAMRHADIVWSVLIVIFCLWELAAFFLGDSSPLASYKHPALTDLIVPLLGNVGGYIICVVLWLIAGVALLRRGRPA